MSLLNVAKKWQVREASVLEKQEWNRHIAHNPDGGNILQMSEFASLKTQKGWKPQYLVCSDGSYDIFVLALERRVPLFGCIWYIPKGPGVINMDDVRAIAQAIEDYLDKTGKQVFFIKLEPEVARTNDEAY